MMKLTTALNYVSQAVGNTKIGHVDTVEVINQAGRHLVAMYPWEWLVRTAEPLGLTAAVFNIGLPPSLKAIDNITFTAGLVRDIRESSLAEIQMMRSKLPTGPVYLFLWALVWKATATGMFPRLEIYPTPTVTDLTALQISYSTKWLELNATDQAQSETPDFVDALLAQFIMCFARGYQRDQNAATFSADLRAIERGPIAQAAMRHDAEMKSTLGPIRNPAVRRDYDTDVWWLTSPAAPPG